MSWRFITIPISIVFLQFVALTLESELRGDLYSEWQLWKRLLHKRYPSADVDRNRFSSWAANLYRVGFLILPSFEHALFRRISRRKFVVD